MVRIEMSDATFHDYERLHADMAALGFYKFITSDDGRLFHLPDAEYSGLSALGVIALRDRLQWVANCVKPNSQVLVTKADGFAWTLRQAG